MDSFQLSEEDNTIQASLLQLDTEVNPYELSEYRLCERRKTKAFVFPPSPITNDRPKTQNVSNKIAKPLLESCSVETRNGINKQHSNEKSDNASIANNRKSFCKRKVSDSSKENNISDTESVSDKPAYVSESVLNALHEKDISNLANFSVTLLEEMQKIPIATRSTHPAIAKLDKFILEFNENKDPATTLELPLVGKKYCFVCKKQLDLNKSLAWHMQTHSTDKKFACPREGCTESYKFNHSLTQHMITHITPERFFCEYCNKGFTRMFSKRNHVKQQHQKRSKNTN